MDARTILIANNKTQRRYTIETAATTLGELKAQMREQGIDYEGMSFTEGITKLELNRDDAVLPTNVMYKGAPTNNLVMLLTNPNKQIASGAMDRKEAYRLVKAMGLQDAIVEGEGVNYTRVKTDVLEEYINRGTVPAEEESEAGEKDENYEVTAPHEDLVILMFLKAKYLVKQRELEVADLKTLVKLLSDFIADYKAEQPEITDSDVDAMIASL